MSAPNPRRHIQHVFVEISGAMSALHTLPSAHPAPVGPYLAQTDTGAAHAVEHLQAAFKTLLDAHVESRSRLLKVLEDLAPYWKDGSLSSTHLIDRLLEASWSEPHDDTAEITGG